MDADSSENEEIARLEQLLQDNSTTLEQQSANFEHDLKQYYSLKAEETVVELNFESWKQLYRKQEAELNEKHAKMRDAKLNIWRDREEFCEYAFNFAKEFSMEKSLNRLRRALQDEDSPVERSPNLDIFETETRSEIDEHVLKVEAVENEIASLRQREAELDKVELEMAPDEETIRRLQVAVGNSASSLEEIEAQIKDIGERTNNESLDETINDREVRSILKRPSFLTKEIDRKQVRFE
nr:uncharacterized protein LOC115257902 [Aedes albopictus]XP_029713741.1 uncharacterized protein LOC115257902 [Aedes albopictus]XP_029713742.1 uncharacterized protein LOC115257902 [Aedes albopictus]XP_029713743.1 uncharacterized protein LOC115257902 [Aedes albopictus]